MFKLATTETIWSRVKVPVASDFGAVIEHQFEIQFLRLSGEERKFLSLRRAFGRLGSETLTKWVEDNRITEKEARAVIDTGPITDGDVVKSYTVGWKDIYNEDGTQEIPFSKEALAKLLDIYPTEKFICEAFFEAQDKAVEKNLKAPRDTGQK